MIETPRLILRPYRDDDRDAIAEVYGHPEVGLWLGAARDRVSSDAWIDRKQAEIERDGFGFWAAEQRSDRRVVGSIGVMRMSDDLPTVGELELGWALHPSAQRLGLATEGATACRDYALRTLGAAEVFAMTAKSNLGSQAVMRRIGMQERPELEFDHPRLPLGHPLKRHVFFSVRSADSPLP